MIFTDRSRYITYFSCPFERYMNYHFNGTGIVKQGKSIPLATGTYVHRAIESVLRLIKQSGDLPQSEDVRQAIEEANAAYVEAVSSYGFTDIEDTSRIDYIVSEQTTLLSGLIWAWSSYILPAFMDDFELLFIEQEMERILDCTCGLSGVGAVSDHISRDCNAVVLMTRPDIVARKYSTGTVAYIELKTGSKIDPGTFEGDVQFAFGAAGIEGYTGEPLSESYVHALSKGYRRNAYNPETGSYDLPPIQQSSLCYAYVKGGISAMVPQDIKFKRGRGVTRAHKRTPVWEIQFKDIPEGIPPIEHYISMMPDEELASHVKVLGPYPYPKQQVEETLADIAHLERENFVKFNYIDSLVKEHGFDAAQAEIHKHVQKSWTCHRYGSMCSYYPICMKQSGWEDPCRFLDYVPREPNHPIEFEH